LVIYKIRNLNLTTLGFNPWRANVQIVLETIDQLDDINPGPRNGFLRLLVGEHSYKSFSDLRYASAA